MSLLILFTKIVRLLIHNSFNNSSIRKTKNFYRKKDPKQALHFFYKISRSYLMGYENWAIFMDCDMLCRADITELWNQRDNKYSIMCVQHEHIPVELKKFQGEVQSAYPKKNWSSLMLMDCSKCKALTIDYVNKASGLELHRFLWLKDDNLIGEIKGNWNYLVGVQRENDALNSKLSHWTLGGPWFKDQRTLGGTSAAEWFASRDDAFKLWD